MLPLSSTASRWLALLLWCCCVSFLFGVLAVHAAPLPDTDRDGIADVWETQVFHTDLALVDTDKDGYSDFQEISTNHNPAGPGDLADQDADHDGLADRLELAFGTDPTLADTDGDARKDYEEIYAGYSPTTTLPQTLPKSLYIRLATQRMEQRVMNITIASYPVSSGKPGMATPIGTYKVLSKSPRAWSNSAKLWMPYWMHFSGRGHGIHELPEWPGGRKEGEAHLGKPVSHGCVRLGVGTAKKIYDWSPIGTPIIVVKR